MNKATQMQPTEDKNNLFQPVELHEKLVYTVLGVLLLIGFILLLMRYAQPTPPGVSVDSKRSNIEADTSQTIAVGRDALTPTAQVQSESTTSPSSNPTTPVPSNNSAAVVSQQVGSGARIATSSMPANGTPEKAVGMPESVFNSLPPSTKLPTISL